MTEKIFNDTMEAMKFAVTEEPAIEKAVNLACFISNFKTKEMELAFARFLERISNPPLTVVKP